MTSILSKWMNQSVSSEDHIMETQKRKHINIFQKQFPHQLKISLPPKSYELSHEFQMGWHL